MSEKSINLLELSNDQLENVIRTMPTPQFIIEAKATLDLLIKAHKVLTANNKQIMDTCRTILESGKVETQEERK